jgi:hypothetical protein
MLPTYPTLSEKHAIPSPTKYYPFERDESGRIRAQLTPEGAKKRRLVYKIKNLENDENGNPCKTYTGKTARKLAERVYGHHYCLNNPQRDAGKKELYEDIRNNPEAFVIGIQIEAQPHESLEELEKACVIANDSFVNGYNNDRGGGGGTAITPTKTPPSTPKLTKKEAKTPTKGYPLDYDERGKIEVLLSPKVKSQRGVVYGFKNLETEEWLIGETGQKIGKRLPGYIHAFNHPKKDVGKLPLPVEVRKAPEKFMFYVLCHEDDDGRLKKLEKAWIVAKNSFENGYNQNRGGGGSSSSRRHLKL